LGGTAAERGAYGTVGAARASHGIERGDDRGAGGAGGGRRGRRGVSGDICGVGAEGVNNNEHTARELCIRTDR
jgi:hypothetical protein